jgi:xanthosine utilization system XapX-like protein
MEAKTSRAVHVGWNVVDERGFGRSNAQSFARQQLRERPDRWRLNIPQPPWSAISVSSGCRKRLLLESHVPITLGVLEAMNSLRWALVGRRQIRTVVWLASLAGMAVGLLFALERVWVAAFPCVGVAAGAMWLVGAWVLPWTRDAHFRRVVRIWGTWVSETQWANAEAARNRRRFLRRLGAPDPPDELRAQHEHLVSLVEEHDRLGRQWPRTPALLSEGAAVQRAEREEKEKLIAHASLEGHRSTPLSSIDCSRRRWRSSRRRRPDMRTRPSARGGGSSG